MINFVIVVVCISIVLKIFNLLTCGLCKSNACLVGKTALILGGNSGIGYEAALALASRGCRIIIADVVDASATKKKITEVTNNSSIIVKHVDFASFKSVRNFAEDINKTEEKLDILISNVGIGKIETTSTEDGLQTTMQVNYFSHFLLTHLLIDLLKKSSPSRIIFTSSWGAFLNDLTVKNLQLNGLKKNIRHQFTAYFNAKLCLTMAADGFASRLEGSGVTCNSLHPGVVRTNIFQSALKCAGKWKFFIKILEVSSWTVGKDPWEGAQTIVHLACSKEVENVTGKFFSDCKPFFKPLKAYNKKFCKEIWEASEELVNLAPHEKICIANK